MSFTEMISYAQNGEDVVLHRAFSDRDIGFYIDVGACHPEIDSVTLHFYQLGWRGLNIEPDSELHALLAESRPQDVNLCLAIGRERSRVSFYPTGTRGHGTIDPNLAAGRSKGRPCDRVPQLMLRDVIDCYGPDNGEIDFLKIDVEGLEADVIASADWARHRPRVVLVESVSETGEDTQAAWEPGLLSSAYQFALFDGLNRFYCREEDASWLLPRLQAPANTLDGWVCADVLQLREEAARLRAEKEAVEQRTAAARAEAADAQARVEALGADLEAARSDQARLRGELLAAIDRADVLAVEAERSRAQTAAALRREEAAESRLAEFELEACKGRAELQRLHEAELERLHEAELQRVHAAELQRLHEAELQRLRGAELLLAATRASTSWRLTAPVRWLGKLVHRRRPH